MQVTHSNLAQTGEAFSYQVENYVISYHSISLQVHRWIILAISLACWEVYKSTHNAAQDALIIIILPETRNSTNGQLGNSTTVRHKML
jgi:hypothetical protein